jgi:hypothetical protein
MGDTSSCSYNQSTSKLYGFVAQWITRLTTDQEIPGSTPGKLDLLAFQGRQWGRFVVLFKGEKRLDSAVGSARVS